MVNIRDPKPPRFIRQTSQPDTPLARAKVRIAKTKARKEAIKKAQNQLAQKYTSQGYQVSRDAQGNPRKATKQSGSRKETIVLDTKGRVTSEVRVRGDNEYRIRYDYNEGKAIDRREDDGEREEKNYYYIDASGRKYRYKQKEYDNNKLDETNYFDPNTGRKIGSEKAISRGSEKERSRTKRPSLAERRKRRKELERKGLSPIQAARKETQEFSDVVSKPSINTGGRVAQRAKEEGGFRLSGQGAESAGGRKVEKNKSKRTNVENPSYLEFTVALKRLKKRGIKNPTNDEFNAQLAEVQRTGFTVNKGTGIQTRFNPQTERTTLISKSPEIPEKSAKEFVKKLDFQKRVELTQDLFKLSNAIKEANISFDNPLAKLSNTFNKFTRISTPVKVNRITLPNLAKRSELALELLLQSANIIQRKENKTKEDRNFLQNVGIISAGIVGGAGSSLRVLRNTSQALNYVANTIKGKTTPITDIKVAGKSLVQAFKTDPYLTSGSLAGAILGSILTYKIGSTGINFAASRLGAYALRNSIVVPKIPKKTTKFNKGDFLRTKSGAFGLVGKNGKVLKIPEKVTLSSLKAISKTLQIGFDPIFELAKSTIQGINLIAKTTTKGISAGTRKALSKVLVAVDNLPSRITKNQVGLIATVNKAGKPIYRRVTDFPKQRILVDKLGQIGIVGRNGKVSQINNPSLTKTKIKRIYNALFPKVLADVKAGQDVDFKVKIGNGKLPIKVTSTQPTLTIKQQLALAGKNNPISITTQSQELVKFIRTSIKGAGRKKDIRKPIPNEANFDKKTKNLLKKFDEGKKLTDLQLIELDRLIRKQGGKGIIERSFFLDPNGNIRPSRGLLGDSAEDIAKQLLPDIGLGSFKAKEKPQILLFINQPVSSFPTNVQSAIKKIKAGKKLSEVDEAKLLRYSFTADNKLKALGKVNKKGFVTGEAEITLAPKELIQYVKKVGVIKFEGKKIPLILADIYKKNKTEAKLIKKYQNGTATKKELLELNKRLKKNTGIDYKFKKSKINNNKNVSYKSKNRKRYISAKDLIAKSVVSSARKVKTSSKKAKSSASKRTKSTSRRKTASSRKKNGTSRKKEKGSSGKKGGTSRKTTGESSRTTGGSRTRPSGASRTTGGSRRSPPKPPKSPKNSKPPKKTRITFNTKLPRGFEYIVDGRIKKGNRVRTVRLRTTPNRARKKLQKLVDNKLIASYDIVAVGAKREKDIQPPKSKKFRLRRGADPKVRKYVELKKYRLDTAGEKRQIQKRRKEVKRKRKETKKK